jgi:CBS domain-containing protein
MSVATICSRRPITAPPSAPLSDIAQLMYENRVGTVILTLTPSERPVAVGIITDRDVIRAQIEHSADLSRVAASQAMTPDPLTVCESDRCGEALSRMRDRGVRRAVVVDSSGALVGIVSTDDLILRLAAEIAGIGRLLEKQAVHSTASF